ncbi:sensor domain-containing diguanylate cyclase [Pseudoduganella umbonata]|uniref:Diguanylate cyclase (GGDEF)-like protein n=1 Tax=Pseudoduganella umbonata TaxID=864828 RepID=A0A7W5HAE8_9BURK|nr:sensor domain-containing diguanylate cyclase [Pseudoduganella umbonata]MBB3219489.1 diguanylate cyclase (GGDEF)-like protein [Pseudoduganella umbonata]
MPSAISPFASVKFKVSALVASMVLIAAIGVCGISLLIAESQIQRMIARQEISALSGAAAYLDNDVRAKQQVLRSIAEEALSRNLGARDVQALLESHPGLRDEFVNVAGFDARGDRVASLKNRRDKIINVSARPYFQEALRTRDSVISAPFRSALSGQPVVSVAQPLSDARGRIHTVLVGGIDLLRPGFAAQVEALRTREQGYLFILANDGTVIHHPRKELILTRPSADEMPAIGAALADEEGWRADILDGKEPSLVAWKRLRHADWTVAVSYPLRDAFAPMASVWFNALGAAGLFTALAGIFGWGLVKVMLEPLGELQRVVESIDAGATDISAFNVDHADEFGLLSRALYRLSRSRKEAADELRRLATTDVLTGTHNRRMFDQFLPAALARARRSNESVAVAFLDVDRFKSINDSYGHAVGDAVLVEFARRLQGAVRCSDTVARLAGDEFVVVFEQVRGPAEAHQLGEKILAAMRAPFLVGDAALPVTASVGIAITGTHTNAEVIMQSADYALYGVKAAGRNGYAVNVVGAEKLASVHAMARHEGGELARMG